MALVWSDEKYATGVKEIDEQHKELFRQINLLIDSMRSGKGKEELAGIVSFLEKYVVKHFACEEQHMDRTKCNACAANKAAHQQFLKEFAALKKTFEEKGPSTALILELQNKLCTWLDKHISKIDVQMRA